MSVHKQSRLRGRTCENERREITESDEIAELAGSPLSQKSF